MQLSLGRLRTPFHHDLQVSRQTQMRLVGIARNPGVDQCASHHRCDLVYQRMVNLAIRDMHDPVRAQFEQAKLWSTKPPADRKPRPQPKGRVLARNERHFGQAVGARQVSENPDRDRGDAGLTETRAARTRRSVRAI